MEHGAPGAADAAFAALLTPAQAAAPVEAAVSEASLPVEPTAGEAEGTEALTEVEGQEGQQEAQEEPNDATLNLSAYQRNKAAAKEAQARAEAEAARAQALEARIAGLESVRQQEVQRQAEDAKRATQEEWVSEKQAYMARVNAEVAHLYEQGQHEEAQAYMSEAMGILAEAEAKRAQDELKEAHQAELEARAKAEVQRRHDLYRQQNPTLVQDLKALDPFHGLLNLDAIRSGQVEISTLHELAKLLATGQSASPAGVAAQAQAQATELAARSIANGVRGGRVNGVGSIPPASSEAPAVQVKLTRQQWMAQNPHHPSGVADGYFKYLTGA